MSTRVPQRPAGTSSATVALRCDRCDVLWRGARDEPCWFCGHEGQPAAQVIIVGG